MKVVRVAVDAALDLAHSIFIAHGASEQTAAVVAEHLVGNDCAGVSSHGIHRVVQYTDDIRSGLLHPAAVPVVKTMAPTRLHVEGGGGFGQVGAMVAVEAAAQAVATGGTVFVTVRARTPSGSSSRSWGPTGSACRRTGVPCTWPRRPPEGCGPGT